jgi:PKD repeat protein
MERMMIQKSRGSLGLALFSVLFLAATGWLGGQENVSRSPGLESLSPRIAADSLGNFHVVWAEYVRNTTRGDAYYSKYDLSTQAWSTPTNLSNNGRVFSHEKRPVGIAIDGADNIYVVYSLRTGVGLRIFSGGTWGAPVTVASWNTGDCDSVRVAVDSLGNIFICWWTLDSYTVHSRARVGGVWEDPQPISAGQSKFCDIAVGTNTVFAAWTAKHNTPVYQIFYVMRPVSLGGQWTAPRILYPGSHKQQVPAVEVDADDIAHVVFTPAMAAGGIRVVRYSRWTGSAFSKPVPLSVTDLLHYPALDERSKDVYVCWQLGPYGDGKRVEFNNLIGGVWTGPMPVPGSAHATYCDVAADPFGASIFYVWDGLGEIWCNMGRTGTEPDNEPPTAEFVFSPTTGVCPVEITFDASSCQDPDGTIASYSWDFGDGGRGGGAIVTHTYTNSGTYMVSLVVRDNLGSSAVKTQSIEILRLSQPLNIRWEFKLDESLLHSRKIAQVTWSENPANNIAGVQVAAYRVYRREVGQSPTDYELCGEVAASVFKFLDKDIAPTDVYVYTVTTRDAQGHESPILGGQQFPLGVEKRRPTASIIKRVGLADRY